MNSKVYGILNSNNILKTSGLTHIHTIQHSIYKTIPELFIQSCKQFKDKQALGYRETLKKKQINNIYKFRLGKYNWINYETLFIQAKSFGCGIRNICNLKQKNKIVLYANTKKEWFIASNGCLLQNYTVVTCYANLGIDALVYSLVQTKSKIIIIDDHQKDIIAKIKSRCKHLKYVIIIPNSLSNTQYIDQNSIGLQCYMFQEIINYGENTNIISLPSENNIAFIMYTSGSTGDPKGIKISHKNLIVSIYGIQERVMLTEKDIYLAYLPLAHILELLAEYLCIYNGAKIGYGTPHTLTNKSNKVMKNTKGDATKLNPTVIAFVPIILDKIRFSIEHKIEKSPNYIKKIFREVYDKKHKYLIENKTLKNYNEQNGILNIIKKCLGTNLRSILSGGASLNTETKQFFNICFDINILEGYGLTETCGSGCISCVDHFNHNTVGPPLINNYIRLIDWKKGKYMVNDKKGEILIGGDNVTCGYYKNKEQTKKNFYIMNGIHWFKTGDIGQIHPNGTLEIIDRKIDIIKMSSGEYLSYSKVENIIKESKYVENCMFYVNKEYSDQPLCVISVTDSEGKLSPITNLTKETKETKETKTLKDLCQDKNIIEIVKKSLDELCKKKSLKIFETPKQYKLSEIQWTVENNMVTSTFKIKRKNIIKYYEL
jgi:long-chain acyl-CoA synthetase